MAKNINIDVVDLGKAKLTINDGIEIELNKTELRDLLYKAENALDALSFLEVKHWTKDVIRD